MSETGTLEWSWPWPPKGCKHEKCELGFRALRLMNSGVGVKVSTPYMERTLQVGQITVTHRLSVRRGTKLIQLHYDKKQVLKFGGVGLMKTGTPGEIAVALEVLRKHMVLEDLADV